MSLKLFPSTAGERRGPGSSKTTGEEAEATAAGRAGETRGETPPETAGKGPETEPETLHFRWHEREWGEETEERREDGEGEEGETG